VTPPWKLFILNIRKTIRTGKKKFDHTAFVELFTAHLLKKIQDFIIYLSRDICEIKKRYNTMDTQFWKLKKNVLFF
jgi:hypothetical protein